MKSRNERSIAFVVGILLAMLMVSPAVADDTELFVYKGNQATYQPNILFIFDTSGSMKTSVTSQQPYDPTKTYTGACSNTRVYWKSANAGGTNLPGCGGKRWFDRSAFKCKAALDAFATTAGRWLDYYRSFDTSAAHWQRINKNDPKSLVVECSQDSGVHGDGVDATKLWAQNGDASNPWTSNNGDEISWTGPNSYQTHLTAYDGNYLNWSASSTTTSTRQKIMQSVAKSLVNSLNGVNVGLMRYNDNAQGGHLVHPVSDITTGRSALLSAIDALPANSNTPLSETLYEAALYYLGRTPDYGKSPDNNETSTLGLGTGPNGDYISPVQNACQKNYIVYLTDGEPTADNDANSNILGLTDNGGNTFSSLVGSAACDAESYPATAGTHNGGDCLDDLAEFLHDGDMSSTESGNQGVTTYTVGFSVNLPILVDTAHRGGGDYYTVTDTASLTQALTQIVTSILNTQTTFTAPTVSVDSFNRTRHRNDMFITTFQPAATAHWPGNLKKYKLQASDTTIIDANSAAAIDPLTGFFADAAQSYWSAAADGPNVIQGGAANELPSSVTRNVYTYLGNKDLTVTANAVNASNTSITDAMLNIGSPGDPAHADVISFIRGVDVEDSNQNNSTTDDRDQMGDPLHSQPVSMVYGGSVGSPDPDDAVVYFATNDGYLHAIDPKTGVEKWAFVPPEFLGDQAELMLNPTIASRHYGIDGSLRLQVHTVNNDGIIDSSAGERVYLYFGMRRGGSFYYGLDITDPDQPKVLWKLDGTTLPGIGETWSTPAPTRITVNDPAENADHLVLVLGGGYDPTQDNYNTSTDTTGNDIYIVDSVSGKLLWQGAKSGGSKTFSDMDYSIPGDIKAVDLDGDGYADRMYAADMGGQVWRFDITNGNAAASLVNGGVIARLGAAGLTSPTRADTRRFYYSPDVALVSNGQQSFIHIGIGSGYRAHPNSTDFHDRFYALRDYAPFVNLTQTEFNSRTVISENDLTDITNNTSTTLANNSPGWMLQLAAGEKVLAEARTFNNDVYFTTFTPGGSPGGNGCVPQLGTNQLYIISLFNGSPVVNLDESVDANGDPDTQNLTSTDRSKKVPGSISSQVVFLFPSPDDPTACTGAACTPPPVACVNLFCMPTNFANNPVRTTWVEDRLDR